MAKRARPDLFSAHFVLLEDRMNVRLVAALASAAVLLSAAPAAAQTTMAPTAMPVVGPTTTPNAMPMGTTTPTMMPPVHTMAPMMIAPSTLALDARYLRGTRTPKGYVLTGQAEVRDACTAAKFQRLLGNVFPPFYNVMQYRRPGTMNLLCIQRLTWVTIAPLNVASLARPRYVNVHTAKGTTRVPIR
jgi:hypothetical protein